MDRAKRKLDHIEYAISTGQTGKNGLDDISYIHNSIPLTAVEDISIQTKIGELPMSSPIFINAMTGGGGKQTFDINKDLATVAKEFNLAMSVGSQTSALRDPSQRDTYEIVRKINPTGIVFGNIGSDVSLDDAKRAVDMIEANALQIHINVIQELVMPEGDRDFTNVLRNIEKITRAVGVPVIVKEVGFGMSRETAISLEEVGVNAIDIGGFGGTNFSKIENQRRDKQFSFFNDWGITASVSLIECSSVKHDSLSIISSGGMNKSIDIAKSISLGACSVAFAGHFLSILKKNGVEALMDEVHQLHQELKLIMTAVGAKTIESLQQVPLILSGKTLSWAEQRGIDTVQFSQRKKVTGN